MASLFQEEEEVKIYIYIYSYEHFTHFDYTYFSAHKVKL